MYRTCCAEDVEQKMPYEHRCTENVVQKMLYKNVVHKILYEKLPGVVIAKKENWLEPYSTTSPRNCARTARRLAKRVGMAMHTNVRSVSAVNIGESSMRIKSSTTKTGGADYIAWSVARRIASVGVVRLGRV